MRSYEGIVFLDVTLTESLLDSALKDCEQMITQRGGKLGQFNRFGKRSLGFPMRKQKEAHMVTVDFELPENQLNDLDRAFRLYEKVLKATLVKKSPKKNLLPVS